MHDARVGEAAQTRSLHWSKVEMGLRRTLQHAQYCTRYSTVLQASYLEFIQTNLNVFRKGRVSGIVMHMTQYVTKSINNKYEKNTE